MEFKDRPHVHFFEETTSTMDVARKLAEADCPHMTVVVANRQSAGRGRLSRNWYSVDGGLYFTLVLRPNLPVLSVYRVLFAASVSLARTIYELCDVKASVKWPNDILVGDKKLSGMLSELCVQDNMVQYLNLGIGVNVNNDPTIVEPNSVSIKGIIKKEFSRRILLAGFLDSLESVLPTVDKDDVIGEWKQYASTLGRPVSIQTTKTTLRGVAIDVDSQGALIVELPDGTCQRVSHGDCFHDAGGRPASD